MLLKPIVVFFMVLAISPVAGRGHAKEGDTKDGDMVDAKDLDVAISIAARIPGARVGAVEIRPVIELAGLPEK